VKIGKTVVKVLNGHGNVIVNNLRYIQKLWDINEEGDIYEWIYM
jgi:hypothetical protein